MITINNSSYTHKNINNNIMSKEKLSRRNKPKKYFTLIFCKSKILKILCQYFSLFYKCLFYINIYFYIHIYINIYIYICIYLIEPVTEVVGGPELHINKGSTINLTCIVKFAPEPPPTVIWSHNRQVSIIYSLYTKKI